MPRQVRDVVKNWANGMQNAGDKMRQGAENVEVSPGLRAAEEIGNYRRGVMKSLEDGTTEAAFRRVTLDDWKDPYMKKGVERAIEAASNDRVLQNVAAFQEQFLPHAEKVKQTIRRMPKGTKEQAKARMNAAFDMMSEFKFQR